jgi:hypothetical protein
VGVGASGMALGWDMCTYVRETALLWRATGMANLRSPDWGEGYLHETLLCGRSDGSQTGPQVHVKDAVVKGGEARLLEYCRLRPPDAGRFDTRGEAGRWPAFDHDDVNNWGWELQVCLGWKWAYVVRMSIACSKSVSVRLQAKVFKLAVRRHGSMRSPLGDWAGRKIDGLRVGLGACHVGESLSPRCWSPVHIDDSINRIEQTFPLCTCCTP